MYYFFSANCTREFHNCMTVFPEKDHINFKTHEMLYESDTNLAAFREFSSSFPY